MSIFRSKQKAIDHAYWLIFSNRISDMRFNVFEEEDNDWKVFHMIPKETDDIPNLIPCNYKKMSYDDIRHIRMDDDPLPHWEELMGTFATMDGELLRFILHARIPLKKIIRYELARPWL